MRNGITGCRLVVSLRRAWQIACGSPCEEAHSWSPVNLKHPARCRGEAHDANSSAFRVQTWDGPDARRRPTGGRGVPHRGTAQAKPKLHARLRHLRTGRLTDHTFSEGERGPLADVQYPRVEFSY